MKARTAAASATMAAALAGRAYAAGSDTIKIGLVGTGGRGTRDVTNCAIAAPGVVIWALGDLFEDRVRACYQRLKKSKKLTPDQFQVTEGRCFHGWDNHKRVIDAVDLVLLCQPPGFRPAHLRAAIEAGKHVFAEKPVAVCPAGVRHVIESAKMAEAKGLAFVAGTQTRHNARAIETVKRIHDGAIGRITHGACYFLTGELWHRGDDPKWSEMEYQCRNWYYFTWLSGDHIVEQHIHQHDIMNWVMQANPVKAYGTGGRQVRTAEKWPGRRPHPQPLPPGQQHRPPRRRLRHRHQGGRLPGARRDHRRQRLVLQGRNARPLRPGTQGSHRRHPGRQAPERGPPHRREHHGRRLRPHVGLHRPRGLLEVGEVSWKWVMEASKLDLMPTRFAFGPHPVPPVAVPGKTKLV